VPQESDHARLAPVSPHQSHAIEARPCGQRDHRAVGGPTVVINQVAVGVLLEARRHAAIAGFSAPRHASPGILKDDLLDLSARETPRDLEVVRHRPGGRRSVRESQR